MSGRRVLIEALPKSVSDGNVTMGRQARFASIYFQNELVGGMQGIRFSTTNGSRHITNIGNDWLELAGGVPMYNGSCERYQVRSRDIFQIAKQINGNISDADFRDIIFDIRLHQDFDSVTGRSSFEDYWRVLHTVTVTNVEESLSDPTALWMENSTFIFKGVERYDNQGFKVSNDPAYWSDTESQKDFLAHALTV